MYTNVTLHRCGTMDMCYKTSPFVGRLQSLGHFCAEFASLSKAVAQELLAAICALCHSGKNMGFAFLIQKFDVSYCLAKMLV